MKDQAKQTSRTARRGVALVYMAVLMAVLMMLASLAVDFGHAELVKMEAERTADAAARYASQGLSDSTSANENYIDGRRVTLQNSDVECGNWNSATNTFTPSASSPNAVRVTVRCTRARNASVLTPLAMAMGVRSVDVTASSVASISFAVNTVTQCTGLSDPWLAGEPNGTTANYLVGGQQDSAPAESPTLMAGLTLSGGTVLNFSFTGNMSNGPSYNASGCDGNTAWIVDDNASNGVSEHGIADIQAPIAAIIGVFLDNNLPDNTSAPASLDFSTAGSRDFATLSPALKQPFYIGDGLRADGTTKQGFVVPAGATRLYIGVMDGYEWNNNSGTGSMTVNTPPQIRTVK
jgi:Flp pilus assembly protein TadG